MVKRLLSVSFVWCLFFQGLCLADTIKHKSKDIVYHGYATQQLNDGKNIVVTQEQGTIELNLADYTIEFNSTGRNNFVSSLSILDAIMSDLQTKTFEEAIVEEANKGPLFILIPIDTPGGRVDLAKQLCAAITGVQYCQTVAYITGGTNGGAFSAGAAISFACDKIYMSPASCIGAATMIATSESGNVSDMKKAYGNAVGEKFDSAWRTYLASLAQENGRSGAIAKAMADRDIEVIEVKQKGKTLFIEPKDKKDNDVQVRVVCQKGKLLTLTAEEAKNCQVADGIVASGKLLLSELGLPDASIVENQKLLDAKEEFDKVVRKFNKLNETLDLKFRELEAKNNAQSLTIREALRDYGVIIKQTEYLLKLKRSYPDIPYDEDDLVGFLNETKARYSAIKAIR